MKTDRRWRILSMVAVTAVVGGTLVYLMPERAREVVSPALGNIQPATEQTAAAPAYGGELHERFQQAAAMLHAGQYDYALAALERVLELAPMLPEAHVNAGFALVELGKPERAAEHFQTAMELRPGQANAYYGLALAYEAVGDLASAVGAMRTYIHLTPPEAPHLRRAQAAIWEWESRHPAQQDKEPPAQGDADKAPGRVNS